MPSQRYARRDRERSVLHQTVRAHLETFLAQTQFHRDRASRRGHPGGHAGSVTVIQRFGGALNVNPHFHVLVSDRVFLEAPDGTVRFHRLPPPSDSEIADLLATIVTRVRRLLIRRDIWREGDDGVDYVEPTLHERLGAAAIQQVALTGPRAHRPTRRIQTATPTTTSRVLGRRHARQDGFDLHANTACGATTASASSASAAICSGLPSPNRASTSSTT